MRILEGRSRLCIYVHLKLVVYLKRFRLLTLFDVFFACDFLTRRRNVVGICGKLTLGRRVDYRILTVIGLHG